MSDRPVSRRSRLTASRTAALSRAQSRSYHDRISAPKHTRGVFGLKYRSKAAHERYKADYLRFKRSLQPFADQPHRSSPLRARRYSASFSFRPPLITKPSRS